MKPIITGPRMSAGRIARSAVMANSRPRTNEPLRLTTSVPHGNAAAGAVDDEAVDEIARDRAGEPAETDQDEGHARRIPVPDTRRRRRARASIDGVPALRPDRIRGVLIAAEGLDGSGKSAGLDGVARWLERKGRRVHLVTWRPSRLVARAAGTPGGRQVLTPRVAALLAASEAARRIAVEIERPLARGDVVLADRYAWTAVAREVARGLDPAWVASLYRFAPRSGPGPVPSPGARRRPGPGHRDAAVSRPAGRPSPLAYGAFLERLMAAYEGLLEDPQTGPWPVDALVIDPRTEPGVRVAAIREAIRPMLTVPTADRPGARGRHGRGRRRRCPSSGDDHRDPVGPARRPRPARRAVRPRGDRPVGSVDPPPAPRRASALRRSRRGPDVAGQLGAERRT